MATPIKNRTYQGFTTVQNDCLRTIYDVELVKQDLLNVFNTSKNECITDPTKGSIIWDMLFEAATQENMNIMKNDTIKIFQSETRVTVINFNIVQAESNGMIGYVLTAQLQFNGLGVSDNFTVNFLSNLKDNGV